jgi:hypothetical protein
MWSIEPWRLALTERAAARQGSPGRVSGSWMSSVLSSQGEAAEMYRQQ